MQRALPADVRTRLERQARESMVEQQRIEAADTVPFEEFRRQYVSPQRLVV
jgi:glutamate--cysteine ligase